jgi:hypothetical protein
LTGNRIIKSAGCSSEEELEATEDSNGSEVFDYININISGMEIKPYFAPLFDQARRLSSNIPAPGCAFTSAGLPAPAGTAIRGNKAKGLRFSLPTLNLLRDDRR